MIYIAVILGIFACSCSQLFLKQSADAEHKSFLTSMLNCRVALAYIIFFASLCVNIWAMKNGMGLKALPVLESLGYIFVPLLSFVFLKEQISHRTVIALFLITLGIVIFNA